MKFSKELYDKLKEDFYRSNHSKYRKYFDEWYNNLTVTQVFWYCCQYNINENNIFFVPLGTF